MNLHPHLNEEGKVRVKIDLKNKEIKYFIVNERGRILETGELSEEKDTFQDTFIDFKSLEVGEKVKLTFNRKVFTMLNYETVFIEVL
jgi:hypothetical protein